jgi:hypothetical protein
MTYAAFAASTLVKCQLAFQEGDKRKAILEISKARHQASRLLNILYFSAAAISLFILSSGFPNSVEINFLGVSTRDQILSPSSIIVVLGVVYVFALQFYANFLVLALAGKQLCSEINISEYRYASPNQDLIALFVPPNMEHLKLGKVSIFSHILRGAVLVLSILFVFAAFLAPLVMIWTGIFSVPSNCTLYEKAILFVTVLISNLSPIMFLVFVFQKFEIKQLQG